MRMPSSGFLGSRRLLGIAPDRVQHAVDEATGFTVAEAPRDLDRLVDHHARRHVRPVEQLGDRQPQHGAVGGRQPLQRPIARMPRQHAVYLIAMRGDQLHQLRRESAHAGRERGLRRPRPGAALAERHRSPPSRTSGGTPALARDASHPSNGPCAPYFGFFTDALRFAISIAESAASHPRPAPLTPVRSRACSM